VKSIYSPWRFDYVANANQQSGCIFCQALRNSDDLDSLILYKGNHNFVILNRYPYNNGHIMIAPYQHLSSPMLVDPVILEEMMEIFQTGLLALTEAYRPDGFNMGMNLGKSAGAGIEEHYHLHLLPRWNGDTNFMGTVAETRIIPEAFSATMSKLKPLFESK
jgi:ATP adenylyltransferase